jgi:hypothetical protein
LAYTSDLFSKEVLIKIALISKIRTLLEESIRGDKAAVEEYKEVLENTALAPRIASLLRDQYKKISIDLYENRTLEDFEK